jgi:hypothetical protein
MKPLTYTFLILLSIHTSEASEVSGPTSFYPECLITRTSIGGIAKGMKLSDIARIIPKATLTRSSDGDGAALVSVMFNGSELMSVYAREEDPDSIVDLSKRVDSIETFNSICKTASGIGPGTPTSKAEKAFGPVVEIVESEIESRQYITFKRQPAELTFRIDYTGIFCPKSHTSKKYSPDSKIQSVAIH